MNTLDMDQFHSMSVQHQDKVLAWLRAHGLNPNVTFRVQWDGNEIKAEGYTIDRLGNFRLNHGRLQTRLLTVPQVQPFPVEATGAA